MNDTCGHGDPCPCRIGWVSHAVMMSQINASVKATWEEAERVMKLCKEAIESEQFSHGHQHWDSSGRHGAGCDLCRQQYAASEKSHIALAHIDEFRRRAQEGGERCWNKNVENGNGRPLAETD